MVTLGTARRVKPQVSTVRAAKEAARVLESARVSREYLLSVRPGSGQKPGTPGGLKPGKYATLRASMERVARMSEDERDRFARLKPIKTDGQAHKALQLRIQGMPYWQIAEEMGEGEDTVTYWVTSQLQGLRGEEVRNADVARQLHLARADALMKANWAKAMTGDVNAATIVLRCMERSSKLLGLDAPQKVDITHRLRLMAEAEGLDYEELLAEANDVIKRLPPAR
jgi:hypothetical protein